MRKMIPINTTADGCAFTIVSRYDGRAYLKSMTGGADITLAPGYWRCMQMHLRPIWEIVLGELPRKA